MEGIALTIKFALFLAMGGVVVATLGGALILGLYWIVRSKVSESRLLDEIASEPSPVVS